MKIITLYHKTILSDYQP